MGRIIGITGNICSGKSTVANLFAKLGAKVVSYDRFIYDSYKNPYCRDVIVGIFGYSILVDGQINRTNLKIYLKEHPEKCKLLWEITDKYSGPLVLQFFQENLELSFFECTPLYEKSWDKFCNKVITCYAPDNLRVNRLMERARTRDGFYLTENEAKLIIGQQAMSQQEKAMRAGYVLYNGGDFESLESQAIILYNRIVGAK